jgi:hypothetical protein
VVPLVIDEDLGLVLEAPERGGVNDAVPVTLEVAPGRRHRLWVKPAAGARGVAPIRRPPSLAEWPHGNSPG